METKFRSILPVIHAGRDESGRNRDGSGRVTASMNKMYSQDNRALSEFGGGETGYIKPISTEAAYVENFFPEIKYARGVELFALYAANGTPLMISATLDAARENARVYRLAAVTVH